MEEVKTKPAAEVGCVGSVEFEPDGSLQGKLWLKVRRGGRGRGRDEVVRTKTDETSIAELQHHVRIRDGDGQDQAQQGDRSPTAQPAQDGEGRQKGYWPGFDSQRVQTPSSAHDGACLPETHEGLLGEVCVPKKCMYKYQSIFV